MKNAIIAVVKQHSTTVSCLDFNPHKGPLQKILASGGKDGKLFLTDIADPTNPKVFKCPGSDVNNGEIKGLS